MTATSSSPFPARLLLDILDATSQVLYLKDIKGRYLFVNRRYAELANAPREAVLGRVDAELFPEPVAALFVEQDQQVIKARHTIEFEETIPLPDGVRSFITSKFPLLDDAGEVYAVGGFCTDITSRDPGEDETLTAERERLSVTLDAIDEAVVSTDREGSILTFNHAATALFGEVSNYYGRPMTELLTGPGESCKDPCRHVLEAEKPVVFGEQRVSINGSDRVLDMTGSPVRDRTKSIIGTVFTIREVTDRVAMENELFNARKLESLGVLAGGIAHDFNNLLTIVQGNVELAMMDESKDCSRQLAAAVTALTNARGLTHQLLTFARGGTPRREPITLEPVVRDASLFSLSGSEVVPHFEIAHDLQIVNADHSQLAQVVQNICLNARQAMPSGGDLLVKCNNLTISTDGDPSGLKAGCYCSVEFIDDGPGLPAESLDRIFDPYFTTREEGTGLGLSVAFSIAKRHGGALRAWNLESRGACFQLLLPATSEACHHSSISERSTSRSGRLLVMDDDALVRQTLVDMLTFLGHEVEEATRGEEVIQRYQEAMKAHRPFDLVIVDLTIPGGMGGRETVEELHKLDNDVKAIVISGYSKDPCLAQFREYGFIDRLAKPHSIEELAECISGVLGPQKKNR